MTSTIRRRLWLLLLALGLLLLLAYALKPRPLHVETATARHGVLQVSIDEDGRTRVKERYVVSAPLGGRLLRIDLEPGDEVQAGKTRLAAIEPDVPALLDPRALAQGEAQLLAAAAALQQRQAQLERARQAESQAAERLHRLQPLFEAQLISRQELDDALFAQRLVAADHAAARYAIQVAEAEVAQAQAALLRIRQVESGQPQELFPLLAPASGQVLRLFQESAAVVLPGTPLLEIGQPQELEIVIDVLSSDAVRIRPGQAVLLEHWGGTTPLRARVRRVEPAAVTKISALGVEEQRVDVIVDLEEPVENRPNLGDGYRVEARVLVWEEQDVLKVPAGALFRRQGEWNVFTIEGRRARLRAVRTGQDNGLETEILEGLTEGERVIVHPSDKVRDGVTVRSPS